MQELIKKLKLVDEMAATAGIFPKRKIRELLAEVIGEMEQALHKCDCSTQLPPISESFKDWCRETKRNGGVLIGSSIREFFEWDEAKYGRQVRRQLS